MCLYSVPEYYSQSFNPSIPYRYIVEKKAYRISNRLIKVTPSPLAALSTNGFYVYIILKNNRGKVISAFTDDPDASAYITPQGVITDIFYEKDKIHSFCNEDGLIQLNEDVDSGLTPYVTFRYEERFV